MELVLEAVAGGEIVLSDPGAGEGRTIPERDLPELVAHHERAALIRGEPVRWVWDSTASWYPELLRAGVRVSRCRDLRLGRAILQQSLLVPPAQRDTERPEWDAWDGGWGETPPAAAHPEDASALPEALFDPAPPGPPGARQSSGSPLAGPPAAEPAAPPARRDPRAEARRQRAVLDAVANLPGSGHRDAHRLQLLLAVESAGSLAAIELEHDGLPFREDIHERTLTELLGPRPAPNQRPARLEELAVQIRALLDAPGLNPDSPPHLLRELRRHGLDVTSTNRWELARADHPVIAPLLEYKKRARLASANGWTWREAWVREGRFRSGYVPGGVVTGRWASRGGGALSLPKIVRPAVRADKGWRLVVADAAQLEPRILAAMSSDPAMLAAGARGDLYAGLVEAGVVDTRAHAKVGMLAALYGATTGTAATLLPRIARAYPAAMRLVDTAARTGESGGSVSTWLGRSSPVPHEQWHQEQRDAAISGASVAQESRARSRARDWGRFTRNFVVQGSAAEWALAWLAGVRLALAALDPGAADEVPGAAGGLPGDGVPPPSGRRAWRRGRAEDAPRLSFFLHDELVVHTPAALTQQVVAVLREAADGASRLLFPHVSSAGSGPLVPLDLVVVDGYDEVDAVSAG